MTYTVFKTLHILGVVLLVGNVTVTAVWKVLADFTRHPRTIAFAQGLVTFTDWSFTLTGVIMIMVGGYGMAWIAGLHVLRTDWLLWSQVWFYGSGLVWVFVLIPIQIAQARQARVFRKTEVIPRSYYALCGVWITVGVLSTLPLGLSLYHMVAKR